MSDVYFIYRESIPSDGYVEEIGRYLGYISAKIRSEYIDNRIKIDSLEPCFISKELAYSWMFADCYDGKISIKQRSNVLEQLRSKLSEKQLEDLEEKVKIKYELTEQDKNLGAEIHKIILKKIISDRFSAKFLSLKSGYSLLELESWEIQKEEAFSSDPNKPFLESLALASNTPLDQLILKVKNKVTKYKMNLSELLAEEHKLKLEVDQCKDIADCHRLRHLKFGVSMSVAQMKAEGIDISPATLKMIF